MNTKISSSWLLALALCTPLGVWADGESNTENSCQATFSVSDQTLTIPCVEVVMGNETVLYSAQLQQMKEGSFALTQVAELSATVESDCVASYSLESGRLVAPCVEEVNPPALSEYRQLILNADKSDLPSFFTLDSLNLGVSNGPAERQTRASNSTNSCDNPTSLPKYRVDTVRTNVYAVAVYLCAGAKIVPFVGERTKKSDRDWACNGVTGKKPSYSFPAKNVKGFIASYPDVNNGSVAISGSFHDDRGVPSFPIMVSGNILTYGDDPCNHSKLLRVLRVNETQKRAVIKQFDMTEFENSQLKVDPKTEKALTDTYSMVVGFDPNDSKDSASKRGRNFVCAKNFYNGGYGTLVFLIGKELTLTQKEAQNILTTNYSCASDQIMMFDGSTVAQLSYKATGSSDWTHAISDPTRSMPQIFVVK